MSKQPVPTHAVAAVVFLVRDGRFLLLQRATPPLIWAPPSGRLLADEDPRAGARRELLEETGLEAGELHLVDYWFGPYRDGHLLSLDFVAEAGPGNVRLSEEHSDFRWSTVEDLHNGRPPLGEGTNAFPAEAFESAWRKLLAVCAQD